MLTFIISDSSISPDSIEVLDERLVSLRGRDVERRLAGAVGRVHHRAVVHEDARHVHVAAASGQVQRRVARRGARLRRTLSIRGLKMHCKAGDHKYDNREVCGK